MEFEKSFFKGEVRDGFFVEEKMKRAWAAQLEVLKVIEQICKKHGLTYFAAYGTMLGAVRHKGFIPWDDDIDIFMLRDDYEQLCGYVRQEAPKGYDLLNIYTTSEYTEIFARLVNGHEIKFSEEHLSKFHGCPYVVGVDIFPLDFVPRGEEETQLQKELYQFIMQVKVRVEKKEEIEQGWLDQIEELCKVKIKKDQPLLQQLLILMDRISLLYHRDECDEVAILHSYANGFTPRLKKEWFEKVIWMPFENTVISVPIGYDECLKIFYNNDYMTPKIHYDHDYPFYARQDKIIQSAMEKAVNKKK